jgi:basic amino acid/polyamine antiporter, APA family
MHGKKIKVYTATLIVIASMIGTGVFTSLGFQLMGVHSVFGILMLWLVGGVIALCGAFSYGELASTMPRSGGEYYYLSRIFHPLAGFLSGWVSATVAFAAPTALAAMALGTYVNKVFPTSDPKLLAISVIIIVTFVHSFNLRQSSRFQNIFTILEIILIIFFIIAGFTISTSQPISVIPLQSSIADSGWQSIFSSSFAVSLIYVSYAYSGWNTATYMASDIENPGRNVPKSLFYGTIIVMILYVLLNYVFLYSSPMTEMKGQVEVGLISAIHIFGLKVGNLMGMMIALLLISSISSFVLAGPRVAQVMGQDLKQLSFLSITNKHGVPYVAKIIQGAISLLLILTSSFDKVLLYIGFTLSLSTFFTVLGLFVLRYRNKGRTEGYKTFGYPFTPIIFLALSGWMLFFTMEYHYKESLFGLGTILAGSIVYFIKKPTISVHEHSIIPEKN